MSEPVISVEDYAAAQKAEWGAYVAKSAIFYDGVRAFNAGDPVPRSHVEKFKLDDLVNAAPEPSPETPPESSPAPANPIPDPNGA